MSNSKVIERLGNHILVDGFHVVVNTEASHDSYIVDAENGKEYLDCYSQFASQPLGWNHPYLLKAQNHLGKAALHKIANSDMYSEDYADFVDCFSEITPDFSHYFFVDGGALGVENALKAAFDWKAQKLGISSSEPTNRMDVIHFCNAFHGRTGYTMSLTNTDPIKVKRFPKFNWTTVNRFENVRPYMHENVAAIIIEPIQGEGGDNHFSPDLFHELRNLSDTHESMLIFDEVQTGVGLTGKMWAYEHFGVIPDMMCFGKKTQVCGFCSTERIDERNYNVFNTSSRINSTWGGNIVDMVRFQYIVEAIKEYSLVENARDVGIHLLSNLIKIKQIQRVRGRGLMLAFDLESTERRDEVVSKLQDKMLVLKCGTKSIRLRPALTFSKEDADLASNYIEDAVR